MRWRKYIDFDVIHLLVGAIVGMGLSFFASRRCSDLYDNRGGGWPDGSVNPDLYGLTIEEINHGIGMGGCTPS